MKHKNMRMKYGTHSIDGDGDSNSGGGSWRDAFSDDNKANKGLADFKDVNGLAKAYLDTKADNGRSIRIPSADASAEDKSAFSISLLEKVPGLAAIPGEDATDEDRTTFFKSLGRPDEASGYWKPDSEDEAVKASLNALAASAHKVGLTNAQFKALSTSLMDEIKSDTDALSTHTAEEYEKLRLDWGSAVGVKSQAILEMAKQTGAPPSITDAISGRELDMESMKWLDGVVDLLSGPGSQMNFQGDNHESRVTPDEAGAQINEIMNNPIYWEQGNPGQTALVNKVLELQKVVLSAS